jgi:PAT family acetyl-CoA transporter-like MFS transporter 1
MSIQGVYKTIWTICQLRRKTVYLSDNLSYSWDFSDVQSLVLVHLVAKIGFAANDAVTSLKMLEKGFKREDMALMVLIDFPFQILGGWLAAKWSRGDTPLRPWFYAFFPRLLFAFIATLIVYYFPKPPISTGFFLFLIFHTLISSFASYVRFSRTETAHENFLSRTVQFVGISAFHTRISDPLIGGTYMTVSLCVD